MGFSKKKKFRPKNFNFYLLFDDFPDFFLYFRKYRKSEIPKKKSRFFGKSSKNRVFVFWSVCIIQFLKIQVTPVILVYLPLIQLCFSLCLGQLKLPLRFVRNGENPGGIFADFGECSKNSGEKCNGLKNILFLPFCSKFDVVYEKIKIYANSPSIDGNMTF